jgi:hypothetical protein
MKRLQHIRWRLLLAFAFLLPAVTSAQSVDFTSSNLPIIIIDTHGETIPDEPKISADMGVIDNGPGIRNSLTDPMTAYKIGIEIRGVSSQMFPKLQYALETRKDDGSGKDVALLGLPAESDWVLSAGYQDKSLIRNALGYLLANAEGRYASRSRFFELVLNGEYRGVYVLFEKIKRTKNRLNLTKMATTDIIGDNVTGGYIIKIDWENNPTDDGWWSPYPACPGAYQQIRYLYEYPKAADLVAEQKAYIEGYVTDFETAMQGPSYADPVTGYPKYLDLGSAVDVFIISEISRNVDAYRLSAFMFKDRDSKGGKLNVGPVWDLDLAFGNVDYYDSYETAGWNLVTLPTYLLNENGMEVPYWWTRFSLDATFWGAVSDRWAALRSSQFSLSRINYIIDSLAAYLDEAQQRNFEQWPILNEYVWPNNYVGGTYANEISYLKGWIATRIQWMDETLGWGTTSVTLQAGWNIVSLPGPVPDARSMVLYPMSVPGSLFYYNRGYHEAETMEVGRGYWLSLPSTEENPTPIPVVTTSHTLQANALWLNRGWNMIGGISCSVPIVSIDDPEGIVIPGTLYGFDGSYAASSNVEPGNGYWLMASIPGSIVLRCGSTGKIAESTALPDLGKAPVISIQDASGATQRLYWNVHLPDSAMKRSYSLPPIPPGAIFDARFVGDYRLSEGVDGIIKIQTARYPVSITPSNVPTDGTYRLVEIIAGVEGARYDLAEGAAVKIQDSRVTSLALAVEKSVTLPSAFTLEQNYPNPFNPKTEIRFGVAPARLMENGSTGGDHGVVTLKVFDILGREVASLVNESLKPGRYTREFDATDLASGVYMYRLTAGEKSEIKKMILLR